MSTTSHLLYHTKPQPRVVASSGLRYQLEDGKQVLDAVSGGAAVSCLGGAGPLTDELVDVMAAQAKSVGHVYHQSLEHQSGEDLAAWLCQHSDGAFTAAAFLSSGSEAVEAALKLCRQYWVERGDGHSRRYIIARAPSYHGNTLGALAASAIPARRDAYAPFISECIKHVPTPLYAHHAAAQSAGGQTPDSEETYSARLAAELEAKILDLGPGAVMAFIAEPVVGAALGVMPPPRGYFPAIKPVLDRYGVLFIADEVMSGFGRCGELFAHKAVAEGVKPDICAIAKGLGAGYAPISAVLVGERVRGVIRDSEQWRSSHTYQNHPVCCAVALRVCEIVQRENLLRRVRERGEQLVAELRRALEGHEIVFDIRGKGLFIGIEFTAIIDLKPPFAARLKDAAFARGLLINAFSGTIDGKKGEAAILAPAYIVSVEDISDIVSKFVAAIDDCSHGLARPVIAQESPRC